MISYARRQVGFQNRRAAYGQPSAMRASGIVSNNTLGSDINWGGDLPSGPPGRPVSGGDAIFGDGNFGGTAAAAERDPSTWSEAETVAVMGTIGNLLGQAGTVVTGIINGQNQAARDQLQAATAIRIAEIRGQAAAAAEPGLRLQLQQQAEMLASVTRALESRTTIPVVAMPMSRNMKIGLGGAALVAGGLVAYFAMRERPNPTPERKPSSKPFVSAKELVEIRRRLHAA